MARPAALALLVISLLAAGCGDDDGGGDEPAAPKAPAQTPTQPQARPAQPDAAPQDEDAIRETILTWTFEGDCDLMTDRFLEDQSLGIGDTRDERCKNFEQAHQKPQYSEDVVKISDIKFSGNKATAVVGSDIANVEATYTLLYQGGKWRIDDADL